MNPHDPPLMFIYFYSGSCVSVFLSLYSACFHSFQSTVLYLCYTCTYVFTCLQTYIKMNDGVSQTAPRCHVVSVLPPVATGGCGEHLSVSCKEEVRSVWAGPKVHVWKRCRAGAGRGETDGPGPGPGTGAGV